MKAMTIATMLLVVGAAALANPSLVKLPNRTLVRADIKIGKSIGGASEEERNYFQARELPFNSGDFRCQLKPVLFSGTRLAQLCR